MLRHMCVHLCDAACATCRGGNLLNTLWLCLRLWLAAMIARRMDSPARCRHICIIIIMLPIKP
jgi:hypothetical protein